MTASDKGIAERFKRLLVAHGVPLRRVVVFGSRAREDAEPESDLDVLVLVERRDSAITETIRDCAWEIGFDEGLFIQTVVMTKDEAENSPQRSSLLMLAVHRDGVRV